jgi:hypothetical protein
MKGEEEPNLCTKVAATTIYFSSNYVHPNYNSNPKVNTP